MLPPVPPVFVLPLTHGMHLVCFSTEGSSVELCVYTTPMGIGSGVIADPGLEEVAFLAMPVRWPLECLLMDPLLFLAGAILSISTAVCKISSWIFGASCNWLSW